MIVFIVVILAMIGVFSLRLYKTQAAVTEDSLVASDADSMEYQSTVAAARGNILDRHGNVLVVDHPPVPSASAVMSRFDLRNPADIAEHAHRDQSEDRSYAAVLLRSCQSR